MISSLIGIIASSGGGEVNSYESISTTTVGAGGVSSITFSSIPSTYQHLQIRGIIRTATASTDDDPLFRFNSDTGANYVRHQIFGSGSIAGASAATGQTSVQGQGAGDTAPANVFGANVVDILDYANTNKYKTVRTLAGTDQNGYGFIVLRSGLWLNTAAINSITIITGSGANFSQYSSFALYGIKG
jgi:hypothetical protein